MLLKDFIRLDTNRINHSAGCLKLANILIDKNPVLRLNTDNILNLAIYHDIGYSNMRIGTGYHELEGAKIMKNYIGKEVVHAIAFHGGAEEFIKLDDNKEELLKDLYGFKSDLHLAKHFLDVINFIDCHVDSAGNIVTVEERYENIAKRYNSQSAQAKIFLEIAGNLEEFKM